MKIKRSAAAQWLQEGTFTIARSFRLHRSRGAFCHNGWCQQCKVTDENGEVRLACQEPFDTTCKPAGKFVPLRLVGLIAEFLPPWSWQRIAYRPGIFRQPFLEIIRRLSAAPRLPIRTANASPTRRVEKRCGILIIGGGLSGLSAAVTFADVGFTVLLVEANELGGSSLVRPERFDEVQELVQRAKNHGNINIHVNTLCLGLYENGTRAWCTGTSENLIVDFETLVVATGAYDRLPTVKGNDTPGIIGMRAFEQLVAGETLPSNMRVGLYGKSTEIGRAIECAVRAKINVNFVASSGKVPNTSYPTISGVVLQEIKRRKGRLTAAVLSDGKHYTCDLLVHCDSQPTYEIQAQAGAAVELRGSDATLCALDGPTVPLVVGEAAGWFDGSGSARRSKEQVSAWIRERQKPAAAPWMQEHPVHLPALSPDAFVCVCEDVRIRDVERSIAEGYTDIELIKRHTGAGTGPCQGKLCHGTMLACAARAGLEIRIPTPRPLIRPTVLTRLAPLNDPGPPRNHRQAKDSP